MKTVGIQGDARVAPAPLRPRWRRGILPPTRYWGPLLGAAVLVIVLVLVVAGPAFAPYDPDAMAPADRLLPPGSNGHLLGTDSFGRDIFSRAMSGGKLSLLVGTLPIVISVAFGVPLGLCAAFFGGWFDQITSRAMELLLAFPSVLLAIGIVAALGPRIENAILAIAVTEIPIVFRIVRAPVLSLREQEFILAARVIGAGSPRIVARHILPNVVPTVVVFATVGVGSMIIFGSGLSFIGLGAQPPQAEWGLMLAEGRHALAIAPHVTTIPGLLILAVVLALNLVGDGVRDVLDPRTRRLAARA